MRAAFLAVAAAVAAGAAPDAKAGVVTFAQYTQQDLSGTSLTFKPGAAAASLVSTKPGGVPVFFSFENTPQLPADLTMQQDALMLVSSATTTGLAQSTTIPGVGTFLTQPITHAFTIVFERTADYVYKGKDYGRDLLTIDVSAAANTPSIVTSPGSHSGALNFDNTSYGLTYSSGFLDFLPTATEDGAISFSAATPPIYKAAKFLTAFKADSTGTFDADPAPVGLFPMPEPASLALLGFGAIGLGLTRRARG